MKNFKTKNHQFGPVFNEGCEILILGSFPSVLSLKNSFFYGHPQNRFWKVLGFVFNQPGLFEFSIEQKKRFLIENHIALYDVIESCDIVGSSDSSIKNVVPADIEQFVAKAPIKKIFLNGAKAYSLFEKYFPQYKDIAIKLPSTSPANAKAKIDDLVAAWSQIKNR